MIEFRNVSKTYPGSSRPAVDGLSFEALDGEIRVLVGPSGFLTDGQLTSDELTVMEDELSIWPFYYPAPVVRSEALEENLEMQSILDSVSATLDVETIRQLNGQVDIEQEDPEDVARQHLEENGLI